jgi:hypothetical protein
MTVEDAAEALREMREAQMGGVVATAEELAELEAALDDEEAGNPSGGGDGAGPSNAADPEAGARWESEQRLQEQADRAAAEEDGHVEVEDLSSQIEALVSPSKPPAAKKPNKGGD